MTVVAFLDPPQGEVIEKMLRHCGLGQASARRLPPDVEGLVHDLDGCFSDGRTGFSDQASSTVEMSPVQLDTQRSCANNVGGLRSTSDMPSRGISCDLRVGDSADQGVPTSYRRKQDLRTSLTLGVVMSSRKFWAKPPSFP